MHVYYVFMCVSMCIYKYIAKHRQHNDYNS